MGCIYASHKNHFVFRICLTGILLKFFSFGTYFLRKISLRLFVLKLLLIWGILYKYHYNVEVSVTIDFESKVIYILYILHKSTNSKLHQVMHPSFRSQHSTNDSDKLSGKLSTAMPCNVNFHTNTWQGVIQQNSW